MEVFHALIDEMVKNGCLSWMERERQNAIAYIKEKYPEIDDEDITPNFRLGGVLFELYYFVPYDVLNKYKAEKQSKIKK